MPIVPIQPQDNTKKRTGSKLGSLDALNLKNDPKELKKIKEEVFLGSALGVGTSLFCIAKMQKLNMFKWNDFKKISLHPIAIGGIAACSIIGGLITGLFLDKKEYREDKLRESTYQFVGNTVAPISAITTAQYLYHKIEKNMPILQTNKNTPFFKSVFKKTPYIALTLSSLFGGIIAGNKISNYINNKIFDEDINRGIKLTDFLMHIDDLCIGITLLARNTAIGTILEKFIPPALLIPGFMAGTKEEEHGSKEMFDFKKSIQIRITDIKITP